MKIFSIAFKVGCLDLDAIVTESDNDHRFKVEMVTGEPDPIVLRRSDEGTWTIENFGGRSISAEGYKSIQKEIEARLASI
ncbi:MAG TPA: hypothetical protein VK541_07495 [Pedobacter sp.]|uniref:hypothetical protein n=1 Tax=Pedobacter sp. TaxID=1411316 RepID=UPI002C46A386|nr:hypothetical protein [Pedobacter sp.]HMI02308.1 hypothetical protein [Pedobacter sp.]